MCVPLTSLIPRLLPCRTSPPPPIFPQGRSLGMRLLSTSIIAQVFSAIYHVPQLVWAHSVSLLYLHTAGHAGYEEPAETAEPSSCLWMVSSYDPAVNTSKSESQCCILLRLTLSTPDLLPQRKGKGLLEWPGDGDGKIMHRMQPCGWLHPKDAFKELLLPKVMKASQRTVFLCNCSSKKLLVWWHTIVLIQKVNEDSSKNCLFVQLSFENSWYSVRWHVGHLTGIWKPLLYNAFQSYPFYIHISIGAVH